MMNAPPSGPVRSGRPPDEPLLDEQVLRRAFEGLRPDAGEFKRGVLDRVAARRTSSDKGPAGGAERGPGGTGTASLEALSPFLRRAALLLPPGFLPGPATGAVISATGKKFVLQGAPALLALPAISLIVLALTFIAAFRSVGRLVGNNARAGRQASLALRGWWRAHWRGGGLALGIIAVLAFTQPTDALVGLLALSMLALLVIFDRLRESGYASRQVIGQGCTMFLASLGALSWSVAFWIRGPNAHYVSPAWSTVILYAGAALCMIFSLRGQRLLGRLRETIGFFVLFLAVVLYACLCTPLLARPIDRQQMRQFVESFEEASGDQPDWGRWSLVALWLVGSGDRSLNLGAPRTILHRAIERGDRAVGPSDLLAASRLGLLRLEDWQAREHNYGVQHLLDDDRPLPFLEQRCFDIVTLLELRDLTDAERVRLACRVVASMPEPGAPAAIHLTWVAIRTLESLGCAEIVAECHDPVFRVLEAGWRRNRSDAEVAGFFDSPSRVGRRPSRIFEDISTYEAVDLMGLFGVPEPVDLEGVRQFLRWSRKPIVPWLDLSSDHDIVLAAAQAMLETRLNPAEPSLFAKILHERVLLGVLLLAGVCLWATLRAPVGWEEERPVAG